MPLYPDSIGQVVVQVDTVNRHGFNYLVVYVMKRERSPCGRLAEYPLNFGSGMYAEDAPFHGLEMNGHFN